MQRLVALGLVCLLMLPGCVDQRDSATGSGATTRGGPASATASPVPEDGLHVRKTAKVNDGGYGFEPSVEVASDGTIYVTAAQGLNPTPGESSSRIWVSHDGGTSFVEIEPVDASTGVSNLPFGGEGDFAVNDQDHVYFVELSYVGTTVTRSVDGGETWELRNPNAFAVPGGDREWVATGPGDMVAVTWIDVLPVNVSPRSELLPSTWVAVSEDGGLTFPVQTLLMETGHSPAGGIAIAPDGTIAVARNAGNVDVWTSTDHGRTFRPSTVHATTNPTEFVFVAVAADAANHLYAAWVELADGNAGAYYSASVDHGVTWSKPRLVSDPTGAAALPWIDAQEPGHVAVAYYAAAGKQGDPNDVDAPWFPVVTEIHDAASDHPTLQSAALTAQPVARGTRCTTGGLCDPLGHYLQVAIGPGSELHVAWADSDQNIFWGVAGRGAP